MVIAAVEIISGNTIGFAVFKLCRKFGNIISCIACKFFAGFDEMAVIGFEFGFFQIANNVPFTIIAKLMKLESIMEEDIFFSKVGPKAEDICFVAEIVFIFSFEFDILAGFRIKRFRFFKGLTAGKSKNDAKNN